MNEELFQKVLNNRAELSNKKKAYQHKDSCKKSQD